MNFFFFPSWGKPLSAHSRTEEKELGLLLKMGTEFRSCHLPTVVLASTLRLLVPPLSEGMKLTLDAVTDRERRQCPQLLADMVMETIPQKASCEGWEHFSSLLGCSRVGAESTFTGQPPAVNSQCGKGAAHVGLHENGPTGHRVERLVTRKWHYVKEAWPC